MATATITSKGQLPVPKQVRDQLGLHPGDQIDFVKTESGEYRIKKARDPHALDEWVGYLKHMKGTDPDEWVREMRGH